MKEYVYYAVKKGFPDYMEEVICVSDKQLNVKELENILDKKGFDRVRENLIDLNNKPDFIGAIGR